MKFVRKDNLELSDTEISDLFILNYMNSLEGIDIKLYLYMQFLAKKGLELDKEIIAKNMQVTLQELSYSFERLQAEELITKTTHGYNLVDLKYVEVNKTYIPKIQTRTNKAQTEQERKRIAAASAINESYFQGVMSLGWYEDIAAMFKNYSFSEEVMISLFQYCQERKALNKKYVHAVAENWFKGNVKTFEQLEEFLDNYDNIQKIKKKILKSLRLSRNFTKYEEQLIDTWIKDFNFNFDIIEEALKLTISKPNPSLNYVNGILTNWHKNGLDTPDKIKEHLEEIKNKEVTKTVSKQPATKSKLKYQSYDQRIYEDLESFYDNV